MFNYVAKIKAKDVHEQLRVLQVELRDMRNELVNMQKCREKEHGLLMELLRNSSFQFWNYYLTL